MLSCEGGDKMTALKLYSTTLEAGAKLVMFSLDA